MRRILRLWKHDKPVFFAVLICTAVLVTVASFLFKQAFWIQSDDAFVQGDFAAIGAPVAGIVQRVLVDEHQPVKKGQILCELDDRQLRSALANAEEQLRATQALFESARRDFERAKDFLARGVIAPQAYDQARNRFQTLQKRLAADQAQVEASQVNFNYTKVQALADGVIAIRSAQPGQVVRKGEPLFGIVYPDRKWIIAKIKETDLPEMSLGQKVDVEVDAIPGRTFAGKVEDLSPATEGEFGAVPPDPSAGNFTKYVQRVPVKIAFDRLSPEDNDKVRIGLSANVSLRRQKWAAK